MNYKITCLFTLIIILSTNIFSSGTKVIKHMHPDQPLNEKWSWAVQRAASENDGIWIGYSIDQKSRKNCYIGTYITGSERDQYLTLENIIYNRGGTENHLESEHEAARRALSKWDEYKDEDSDIEVVKEIAILIFFKNISKIEEIKISTISLYADLKNKPVIWLGLSEQDESVELLTKQYTQIENNDVKEDLILAVGSHKESNKPIKFLTKIIQSDESNEIREEAVFWLGVHNNIESLDILENTAENDRSENVRENAVFAIYLMDSEEACELLINLAQTANNHEIQKKAIFWLGQKAAEKTANILEDITYEKNDVEIKNQAVFALSQLEDNEGIPSLIEIANNHPSKEVRKKALFWLGESGDSRALDAIINIIRNN